MSIRTLSEYVQSSAERYGERTAVVDPNDTPLTYRELNDRVDRIAAFLQVRKLERGDRVALVAAKSAATVAAILGIMKVGCAYVSIDRVAPPERIRTILKDCQVKAVFVDPEVIQTVAGVECVIVFCSDKPDAHVSESECFSFANVIAHDPVGDNSPRCDSDDLAYIIYTSGSTGTPKGVMLTHRNAISFVDWSSNTLAPTENDRFSSHAPFHFDLSIFDLYVALKHGASIHIISEELAKQPRELAQFIATRQLTIWYSTPAILGLLAEYGDLAAADHSSLRLVLFAGEVFPVKQLRRIAACWPHATFCNLYGPTETNVCTYAVIPTPVPPDRFHPYPIGQPCSHCRVIVLGPENQELGYDEEGLLYVSGPSVFAGYWGRPAETAAVFVGRHGVRWYNTGDIVRLTRDEGLIYIGRRDRMVKRRGYRIELDEIENCLYKHPGIASAAVVTAQDAETGTHIVAYLSPAANHARPSIIELKAFCNRHLPSYMNPDVFTFLEDLPRTSTNKVDYRALSGLFASQFLRAGATAAKY